MSTPGRRSILALARQMISSFHTTVSNPVTQKSDNVVEWDWHGSWGTATEMSKATVRMIISSCSPMREPPAGQVLSATMTVWLPGTPPQRVHEYASPRRVGYLCQYRRGAGVELCYHVPAPTWQCCLGPSPQ